jgi:hypothetical protein
LIGSKLIQQGLILLAGLDRLFAHPVQFADRLQGVFGLVHQPVLLFEQGVDGAQIFLGIVVGDAARQHRSGRSLDIERELANTKRTLPVSIYFDLNIGKTFSPNTAQCGQLIEAYSVMVTGALIDPIAMSGSDTGFATSAAVVLCAMVSLIGCSGANRATPASDRAAAKTRRVTISGWLRKRKSGL